MELDSPLKFGSSISHALISVVVPVGPIAHKLKNLIGWIPKCTDIFDLILVVDECGDATYELLTEFLRQDQFLAEITVIHARFGGPGAARNAGSKIARGEWIVFWDADDEPNIPGVLNLNLKLTEESDLVVCGYTIDNQKSQTEVKTHRLVDLALNPGLWRILFRRGSVLNVDFPNILLGEDQVFISKIMSKIPRVEFNDEIIYSYVTSQADQLTSGTKNLDDLLSAADLIMGLKSNGDLEKIMELRLRMTYIKRCIKARKLIFKNLGFPRIFILLFRVMKIFFKEKI
jgi:glycosyltransferase involved in cell wall biosynthesis